MGTIKFSGENDADQKVTYAEIQSFIEDETDATENAALQFFVQEMGTPRENLRLASNQITFNNSERNVDVLIKSDDGSTNFFSDAGNNRIGIGTTSPSDALHIRAASDHPLVIENTTNAGFAGIQFSDSSNSSYAQKGELRFNHADSQSDGSGASFHFTSTESLNVIMPKLSVHSTLSGNDATTLTGQTAFKVDCDDGSGQGGGPGFQIRLEATNDHNGPNYQKTIMGDGGGMRVKNIFGNYGFSEWWLGGTADGNKPIMSLAAGGSTSAGAAQDGILTLYSTTSAWANNTYSPTNNTAKVVLDAGGNSYFTGGNVGIGTASPTGTLTVTSAGHDIIHLNRTVNNVGYGAGIIGRLGNSASTTAAHEYAGIFLQIEDNTDGAEKGSIAFNTSSGGTAADSGSTHAMQITSAGNVGIGTTSPSTPLATNAKGLVVAGTGGQSGSAQDGSERIPTIVLYDTVTDYGSNTATVGEARGSIEFYSSETSNNYPGIAASIKAINESTYNNAMGLGLFTSNNLATATEKVRIDADGNVGIGTTNPAFPLEVDGFISTASGIVHMGDTNNTISFGTDIQNFNTAGTTRMKIDSDGDIGIGTTTINAKLHIRDENDGNDQFSGIRFFPADSETSATDNDFYHNITGFRKGGLMLSGGQTGNYTRTYATLNNDGFKVFTNAGDNTAVNMSTQQRLLIPTGGGSATLSVGLDVSGALTATTKSFDIEHPTKEGKRLHHGSLEGPEHGVYIRGRLEGDVIELPDYWLGLVDEDTITVQLTPNKGFQQIYVDHIEDNKVYVGTQTDTAIDCFYFIQAERKDIDKVEVEYDAVV